MSDNDRLLSSATAQDKGRILSDGCTACNGSKVLCRCIAYIEGGGKKCCDTCSHGAGE